MTLCLGACTVYNDKDSGTSPEVTINDYICSRYVTPLCRIIELTDFFDNYRCLNDTLALDSLGTQFFGDVFSAETFSSEGFEQEYWGQIVATDEDGKYAATLSPYWTGVEATYSVTVLEDDSYYIVYDPSNNDETSDGYKVETEVFINVVDGMYKVESLTIVYVDNDTEKPVELTADAGSGGENLVIEPCSKGTYVVYPVEGAIYYSVTGYVAVDFKVTFYGNYFEILDKD